MNRIVQHQFCWRVKCYELVVCASQQIMSGSLSSTQIKKDDGLSRKVCMRCIGTLEFVNDFHNKCHQTQRQLLLAKERTLILPKDEIKTDSESDKENTLPITSIKTKENVNGLIVCPRRKSSRVENEMGKVKRVKYEDDVFGGDTVPDLDNRRNSMGNLEVTCSSGMKRSTIESKGRLIQKRKMAVPRNRTPLAIGIQNKTDNGDDRVTRLGERNTGRKSSTSTIINRKVRKSEKRLPHPDSRKNVPVKRNSTNASSIEKAEEYVELSIEGQNTLQSAGNQFLNVAKVETDSSRRILQNVSKLENSDSKNVLPGAASLVTQADSLPRLPSDVILPEAQVHRSSSESNAISSTPSDEAGGTRNRECDEIERRTADGTLNTVSIKDDGMREKKSLHQASTVRKSVIESVKNGKTFEGNIEYDLLNENGTGTKMTCQSREMKLTEGADRVSKELNDTKGENVGDFRERRKKSEGQFGKLSELITNEQKAIIETLYTVNMGVVDDEEVCKNIKILGKIKVKCDICGKTYPRMDKCQVHVWGHLNMKPYCCKSCDFVTLTVSNIRCHIRKRHLKIKPFQCNLCEKTYGTAVLLEEHINSHTGAKPYECKQCDFATSNRQVLSYHKTTHKPVKDISCEVCGKKFFSNCRMRAHMIVHNKDRNLMCKLCSTYLCNAEALDKHHRKVHSRDYVCEICGVRTRSKKALTNHENVHSAAKYRCPLCPNVYKSKHMLKEHLLKHQGIRKYKCELCHKSFAQQSHIAAHMSVHMGKRYPCPGCNKLFNRRDNMRIHTRRCKIFKSNPDVNNSCTARSLTQPPQTNNPSIGVSEISAAPNAVTETMKNSTTDTESQETDLVLTGVHLLTDRTDYFGSRDSNTVPREPGNDTCNRESFDQFKRNDDKIIRIGEVEIFPLSNSNVVTLQHEGNTAVTENVLRPECF